ncbi:SCO family protein [Gracilibacillus dipsosauri]|uniref:SCO family protein n=1 Tax=Gracilibacillus dipsosauri TaxID=178340 RepID=A0A317KVU4_9BACI|nr:SCO family protein [Gracilibacillus dipsosauri]
MHHQAHPLLKHGKSDSENQEANYIVKSKNTFSYVIVLIVCFLIYFLGTDGFRAFTAETARVNQLKDQQPKLPEVMLEDHLNRVYGFDQFEGKYLFITFFYASCSSICIELEGNMAKVYEAIPKTYLGKDIVFLSITFDPTRDLPARLKSYHDYFTDEHDSWRMARINNHEEQERLLERLGVIVIPDDQGNFAHNSAFYLIDQHGELLDVLDYKNVEQAIQKVKHILNSEGGEQV